jgi:hypothetical protein
MLISCAIYYRVGWALCPIHEQHMKLYEHKKSYFFQQGRVLGLIHWHAFVRKEIIVELSYLSRQYVGSQDFCWENILSNIGDRDRKRWHRRTKELGAKNRISIELAGSQKGMIFFSVQVRSNPWMRLCWPGARSYLFGCGKGMIL